MAVWLAYICVCYGLKFGCFMLVGVCVCGFVCLCQTEKGEFVSLFL